MPRARKKAKKHVVPNDIRLKIVEAVLLQQQSKSDTVRRFGYAFSTVDSIVRTFEDHGRWERKPPAGGRKRPKLLDAHLDHAVKLIEDNPSLTLQELKAGIQDRFEDAEDFSIQTLSRGLGKHRFITLKRTHVEMVALNDEQSIRDRKRWVNSLHTEPAPYADSMFFDEAGFNLHTTRSVGRARRGERAMIRRPSARGPNMSLLVAVDRHRIQASQTILGSWKGDSFTDFLRERCRRESGSLPMCY